MSEAITAARPYAQAAFEEAQKLNELKAWSDLLGALGAVAADEQVKSVITNPRVTRAQAEALLAELGGGQLTAQQRNFIKVLVENQRAILLPEIAAAYEVLRADAEKSVDVVVASAFELEEAQKQKIATALKARFGREIKLSCQIDRALLGGVVIRAGDKVIDGSARTRLAEMAQALA